uniref:biotin/lipoyl-binding protein n=1 Tax=Candidatus Vondammii sp. HM_W22 TaxID=2687299 RepID=UPI001F128F85|nr:biotin/lipoyl-binding protein [Candidatus Vondammii sp. HM_W22]
MVVVLFFITLITWAYYSEIDEVTKGQGKVIPSGHPQIVQNLEGGIVAEILIREGETVQKGDILLRIDDTRFSADFRENNNAYHSHLVRAERLRAE